MFDSGLSDFWFPLLIFVTRNFFVSDWFQATPISLINYHAVSIWSRWPASGWQRQRTRTCSPMRSIAPVFILMEHVVLQKMRELIGWSGGDSILAPGGSISNLYAFLAARHKMFPSYKERGLSAVGGQLVMFTSDQVPSFSTYSDSSHFLRYRTYFIYLSSTWSLIPLTSPT